MNPHVTKAVNDILKIFDPTKMMQLYEDFQLLFDMWNTTTKEEKELQSMCEDDINLLRLIRTAYVLSIIAEKHSGDFRKVASRYPKFHQLCDSIAQQRNGN